MGRAITETTNIVDYLVLGSGNEKGRKSMKKKAGMIFVFLVICVAILLPDGSQQAKMQLTTEQKKFNTELIELRAKVNQLERELEVMKKVIRINGQNVDISTGGSLKIQGTDVSVEGKARAQFRGGTVTVQASGTNTIQGSLVKIN
jgi:hypothetical protein